MSDRQIEDILLYPDETAHAEWADNPEGQKATHFAQSAYVQEGTFVAFPLCFPGATIPITHDESSITALDAAPNRMFYGGTSGWRTHIFVGMFHGATGCVLDLGAVEGANRCVGIACGKEHYVAAVNGEEGGRLIRQRMKGLPPDLLQEWAFDRKPYEELGAVVEGERIVHMTRDLVNQKAIGTTCGHLFVVDIETGKVQVAGQVAGRGKLAVDSEGTALGLDEGDTLWRYDVAAGRLERRAIELPRASWSKDEVCWARNPVGGDLFVTDDEGRLFSYSAQGGFSGVLAQVPHLPVETMGVTLDGRLYGMCGEGVCQFFVYDPAEAGEGIRRLGVPTSIFQRRRYGYVFGAAATGWNGQIVFGENDNSGHLWLYFPSIRKASPSIG